MDNTVLELKNITKLYPGVVALDDVTLAFRKGEVHAIVGENGAGKSTLIKVITGAIKQTSGAIYFEGKEVTNNSPQTAMDLGIAAVYQENSLLKHLTVAENIYYNRYVKKHGLIDFTEIERKSKIVLERLGVQIDPKMLVKNLSGGYQHLVEIAKSLSRTVRVLIMDEPSASLTNNELGYLFNIIKKLREEGVTIIYISHRLEEIFQLCDMVTVFRDGHFIKTMNVADTNKDELIQLMVNRKITDSYPNVQLQKGEKVLEVKNITTELLKDISFSAYKGERLGFAGLVGSGRTETARVVFGADKMLTGEIFLHGKKVVIHSPSDAIRKGIVLIPEDRKQQGIFLNESVEDNIIFAFAPNIVNIFGIIRKKKGRSISDEQIKTLSIKTPSRDQLAKNLSGGNQQKVILAKWMLMNCDVIIFDEPTRGIDVGAKQEIYQLMNDLSEEGKVVIIISSELPELIGMSDRIIVMSEGKISGELSGEEISQERILELASKV